MTNSNRGHPTYGELVASLQDSGSVLRQVRKIEAIEHCSRKITFLDILKYKEKCKYEFCVITQNIALAVTPRHCQQFKG